MEPQATPDPSGNTSFGQQTPGAAQEPTRVLIDERNLETQYANAFRGNGTYEEVILDFGLNLPAPPQQAQQQQQQARPDLIFHVRQRVILNYYTTKRLAIALGQMIRRHEQQFGEVEMDVAKRAHGRGAAPAQ